MNKKQRELIWFITNTTFLVNYFYWLLQKVILLPKLLPYNINPILLIIVYSTLLIHLEIEEVLSNVNFLCIIFFITIPLNILLLPFFFNSLLNVSIYYETKKSKSRNNFIYKISHFVCVNQSFVLSLRNFCQIISFPLSLFLVLINQASVISWFTFLILLWKEYKEDKNMRNAFTVIRNVFDQYLINYPVIGGYYLKTRIFLILFAELDSKFSEKIKKN